MRTILLAVSILTASALAAQQTHYIGRYMFADTLLGLQRLIDSTGFEYYGKSTALGGFTVISIPYKSSVIDVFVPNNTAIKNAYNDIYVKHYAQLERYATGIIERKDIDYKGFKAMEIRKHKSDYTPELWERIVLIRERLYNIKYNAIANNDSARAEFEQLNDALQIVNVEPNQQFDRWNIYVSSKGLAQIVISLIVFGTFAFFYNRWDNKNKRLAEMREAGQADKS